MSDDPWKGDESNVIAIRAGVVCPPAMRVNRDSHANPPVFTSTFTFEELGIDAEKVRKATERMTFLSIDSMKPKP